MRTYCLHVWLLQMYSRFCSALGVWETLVQQEARFQSWPQWKVWSSDASPPAVTTSNFHLMLVVHLLKCNLSRWCVHYKQHNLFLPCYKYVWTWFSRLREKVFSSCSVPCCSNMLVLSGMDWLLSPLTSCSLSGLTPLHVRWKGADGTSWASLEPTRPLLCTSAHPWTLSLCHYANSAHPLTSLFPWAQYQ